MKPKPPIPAAEVKAAYRAAIVRAHPDTAHGIGVIVSWNFKHLANYQRESGFNRVNSVYGYPAVRIISPSELVYGDEEQNL